MRVQLKYESEFKKDNLWSYIYGCPFNWDKGQRMNHLFGKIINVMPKDGKFYYCSWEFSNKDFSKILEGE